MGNIIREGTESLIGGEVSSVPPHLVGASEAITAENLDPRDTQGATTRKGRSQFGIDNGSGVVVAGLRAWTRDNGTAYVVSRLATTFYSVSAVSWASIGIGGTSGELFRAQPLNDTLVVVVDGLAPRVWSGGAMAALGGTPPANAKYAAVYVSKMFLAGDPANPQTKTFSATNNPADYTTANDAGSITTQDGGGGTINGMVSTRRSLLTFYRDWTDILTGDGVFDFREDRLINRGLVSTTGYVSAGEIAFFASDDAIYAVAGASVSDITSAKVRKTYLDISDKTKVSLGIKGDLLLVVDYGADKGYAYDYKRGVWASWTGQSWIIMDTAGDQTFYAGHDGGSTTQIWKLDTGTLDGSSTITAKWRIPDLSFGWPDAIKNLAAVKLHAKPGLGTTTITYFKNGASTGLTTDVTFGTAGGHAWAGRNAQSALRGQQIGIQMNWTGAGTLYGWAVYGEVVVDAGQIPVE